MSGSASVERARRMIEEQIEALGSLRNGSTRDPVFKSWRQSSLTVIQRIWPSDPARVERFRRVPFSPPSTRADVRETREYFERGCAEAASLLRQLLSEIELNGVPEPDEAPRPESLDPGVAEDDFPTLDLPGGPAREPAAERRRFDDAPHGAPRIDIPPAPPPAPGPPAFEMPSLPELEPERRPEPEPERARGAKPAGRGHGRASKSAKRPQRPRLKDMLGFGDDDALESHASEPPEPESAPPAAPAHREPEARRPGPPPLEPREPDARRAAPPAREPDERDERDEPEARRPAFPSPARRAPGVRPAEPPPFERPEPEVLWRVPDEPELPERPEPEVLWRPEAPPPPPEPRRAAAKAESREDARREPVEEPRPAAPAEHAPEADRLEVESTAEDFLRLSPVFSTQPRSRERHEPSRGPEYTVPAALALAALAADLEMLSVSEDRRPYVRTALLELARQIEHHDFAWSSMREAVGFAMESQAVARRVLPLLVPYLDEAA